MGRRQWSYEDNSFVETVALSASATSQKDTPWYVFSGPSLLRLRDAALFIDSSLILKPVGNHCLLANAIKWLKYIPPWVPIPACAENRVGMYMGTRSCLQSSAFRYIICAINIPGVLSFPRRWRELLDRGGMLTGRWYRLTFQAAACSMRSKLKIGTKGGDCFSYHLPLIVTHAKPQGLSRWFRSS